MSNRKLSAVMIVLTLLLVVPMLIVHPSGSTGAGLSLGFTEPFGHPLHLLCFIFIGFISAYLGREATLMLPLSFLLILALAAGLSLNLQNTEVGRMAILSCVLLFTVVVSSVSTRAFLVSVIFASAIAFQMVGDYFMHIPDIASPIYYILGALSSVMLVIGAGVSLGLAIGAELLPFLERFKRVPGIASFLG